MERMNAGYVIVKAVKIECEEMSNNIDTLQDAIGYIEEIVEELECI